MEPSLYHLYPSGMYEKMMFEQLYISRSSGGSLFTGWMQFKNCF